MAAPKQSGELDRRITISRASYTPSAFNEPEETWSNFKTVWAKRMDASAAESYRAQEVGAEITRRFQVRWSRDMATVDPRDCVIFEGVEHNIVAVRDLGRNEWREIDCVAKAQGLTPDPPE